VVEAALADSDGKQLVASVPRGRFGQASIAFPAAIESGRIPVTSTTLDKVLSTYDDIALMKMDIEGAEELAIAGASNTLGRIRAIIFEDWGDSRLSRRLQAEGFTIERLDGNNSLARKRLSR
jgi:FkbM family methyltransferase